MLSRTLSLPNVTMAIDKASLTSIPMSLATVSIGCDPSHTLPHKINAIAKAGFKGIELGFPDLVSSAGEHLHTDVSPSDYSDLVTAAKVVKAMCDAKHMEIMLLQPFTNFEGWREGSQERKDVWARVDGWIKVMKAAGCKNLQVGSTDTPSDHPSYSGEREDIIRDLQELCDKLAEHDLRLAYENWCWSTHAPDWIHIWELAKAVDRPNIGLCLDTFQSGGGEWADPTTDNGLVAGQSEEELNKRFKKSMETLAATVPADKIYMLQISDAYKMSPPIPDGKNEQGMRPRCQWSMKYRPMPFAPGAYLPVVEMAKGVLGTGFRGWFSVEVFDSGQDGKGKSYTLDEFATDCAGSTKTLIDRCVD